VAHDFAIALNEKKWRVLAHPEERRASMADAQDPDVDVLRRCQSGDESAYRELVERYQKRAFWIAYNMIHDVEESRDLAQEAFVRVFRSIHTYDPARSFYTWLYRIVMNLAIDHLRKRAGDKSTAVEGLVLSENVPGGKAPERTLQERELGDRIETVLAQLPTKYRAVILMRDVDEMSCKHIAKIVGCTHATVRWRLHKARKLFREMWERRYAREQS
jgi:RNA polymerase sigma-70 factor, ECF subfamily